MDLALKIAAEKLGFELDTMSYVLAMSYRLDGTDKTAGKAHIMGFSSEPPGVFLTLCGIDDICGFWPFTDADWFHKYNGCKHCKRILKRIEQENCKGIKAQRHKVKFNRTSS